MFVYVYIFIMEPEEKKIKFDWGSTCLICIKSKKKLHLSTVEENNKNVFYEKILSAAKLRNDEDLLERLLSWENFSAAKVKYHKLCYQNFTSKSSLNSLNNNNRYVHDQISTELTNIYQEKVKSGEIIRLTDIAKVYRQKFTERKNVSAEGSNNVKTSYIKIMIEKKLDKNFTFYPTKGKSDVLCLKETAVGPLIHEIYEMKKNREKEEDFNFFRQENKENKDILSDDAILHRAAGILKKRINTIAPTSEYPIPSDLSIQASRDFVPLSLQKFLSWILNENSYAAADLCEKDTPEERRCLTLAECIIYSSRRGKNGVIPPFHHGLMLELHHRFGSKWLIETLNSYGFCSTYDELRFLLTSLAEHELEKSLTVYVPTGVVANGNLIHEGDDNVDMNTETVDGKNSYHAMARVLFQDQDPNEAVNITRLPRICKDKARALEVADVDSFKILPYQLPSEKPIPPKFKGGLMSVKTVFKNNPQMFNCHDIAWLILRMISRGSINLSDKSEQAIPGWIPFKSHFAKKGTTITRAKYIPAINAKPSEPATVYTTLKKGKEMMEACNQKYSIHTFDQQLYAIAQMVIFGNPEDFSTTITRLGGFHAANTFITCIDKIWGDGLKAMLAESGVYASNTTDQMLDGKQFHRAVRGLILCFEALLQILLEHFFEWLLERNMVSEKFSEPYIFFIEKYKAGTSKKEDLDLLSEMTKKSYLPLLNEFREECISKSFTFEYWDKCLISLQLFLDYIAAERESDWENCIISFVKMLPYFFCCDKPNYSRWGTIYALEMLQKLPQEVKEEFKKGHFNIKLTSDPFRGIWSDMGVETTVIKDTKGSAGIIGLTRKEPSVLRWTLDQNVLGEYSSAMRQRSGCKVNQEFMKYVHEGEKSAMKKKNEEDVVNIYNFIKTQMSDPFEIPTSSEKSKLININSGVPVPNEIQESLINCLNLGQSKLFQFISSRLDHKDDADNKSKNFFDSIKRANLKTFKNLHKSTTIKFKDKTVKKIISPDVVYQRALAVSSNRPEVDFEKILSLPLTAVPISMFTNDGYQRKTDKSELLHALQNEVQDRIIKEFPKGKTITVIDGMAELHSLNMKTIKTFENLAQRMMDNVMNRFKNSDEVHIIFDRYDCGLNPKDEEQNRRSGLQNMFYRIEPENSVPDSKKLFGNNVNKSRLTNFIGKFFKDRIPSLLDEDSEKKIIVAGGLEPRENAFVITKNSFYADLNFNCNHVEADTRIIFHVSKIQERDNDQNNIIVQSPDTDVFVLLVSHYQFFANNPKIWFYTGKNLKLADNRRFIPIQDLANLLNNDLAWGLLTAHALTGCDTNSSFFGIGKKKVYSALKKMTDESLKVFRTFSEGSLKEDLKIATNFVSGLYDVGKKSKADRNSINSLRYHLAIEKNPPIDKLPPSFPAFYQHVLRTIYQVKLWVSARTAVQDLNPLEYGYEEENNVLRPILFKGDTAMDMLKNFFCSCPKNSKCGNEKCVCFRANLKCCAVCACCSTKCAN